MVLEFEPSPMPESDTPDYSESREVLARFTEWVGYFLARMVEYRDLREPDEVPYFEPSLTESYQSAWYEFRDQGHIEHVAAYLRDPRNSEILERAMFEHGLWGRQLWSKLSISNFYSVPRGGIINRRARAWLSRLLASIDSLLKSLLDAVPGGGAIEELKEMLENIRFVEDDAEWD